MRRPARFATALMLLAVVAAPIAACGGDEESSSDPQAAPDASAFPAAEGTLEDMYAQATPGEDLVVSPTGATFTKGLNRLGFGVFRVDNEQVTDAEAAIYVARGPDGEAQGPFPARIESLETEPAFTAETTAGDPDSAQVVYVSEVELDDLGEWRAIAMVEADGELRAVRMPSLVVSERDPVPAPGEPAPEIHTPTADEVANIQEIDTRIPPSSMHEVDFADVRGEQPAVLLFATPALCQSRVCGPVVDVAEQVKRDHPEPAYIHMEIFADNTPPRVRPQVAAFNLRTEPWLFVIDCEGRVDTRIEGAFSADELTAAVDEVTEGC